MKTRTNTKKWLGGVLSLALLGISLGAEPAAASPVIAGDVDQIVSVDSDDCIGCSQLEQDVLERGVGMMLGEMRREAVDSAVCVAEASLAKDMAVLTFDAYRAGAITESRWRDGVRYKGRFAGALTEATIETMLAAFRKEIEHRLGMEILPGSGKEIQTDIWASAQLARLFARMAKGGWQDTWLSALDAPSSGFDPTVDVILGLRWPGRAVYNEILVYSSVHAHWREAELARLTGLRDDFLVGSIGSARDQLLVDYRNAMAADPWTTMTEGCAFQAAVGFRNHAMELARSIRFIALPQTGGSGQPEKANVFVDDQGNVYVIHEEIDVVGEMPPISDIWFPPPTHRDTGPDGPVRLPPRNLGDPGYIDHLIDMGGPDLQPIDNPAHYGCNPEMQSCFGLPRCSDVLLGTPCYQTPINCEILLFSTILFDIANYKPGKFPTSAMNYLCKKYNEGL